MAKNNFIGGSTIRLILGFSWKIMHDNWTYQVAIQSIFKENTVVFVTFFDLESFFSQNFNKFASNLYL